MLVALNPQTNSFLTSPFRCQLCNNVRLQGKPDSDDALEGKDFKHKQIPMSEAEPPDVRRRVTT